jgi:ATP synthase protein I
LIPKKDHSAHAWDELDEQQLAYRTYSKKEMDALRQNKSRAFFTLSPWAVIGLQLVVTLLSALAWSIVGIPKGLSLYTYSALLGGFIGFFPASLFALRLSAAKRMKNQNPGSLLAAIVSGEFIKIAVTIAMFVWVAFSYPDLQWIPLLVTYFVTLKCYWLAWFWR